MKKDKSTKTMQESILKNGSFSCRSGGEGQAERGHSLMVKYFFGHFLFLFFIILYCNSLCFIVENKDDFNYFNISQVGSLGNKKPGKSSGCFRIIDPVLNTTDLRRTKCLVITN